MKLAIKRYTCPNFSENVADCAVCMQRFMNSRVCKPDCFEITEDGQGDIVVTIKAADTFVSSLCEEPLLAHSTTDWLG